MYKIKKHEKNESLAKFISCPEVGYFLLENYRSLPEYIECATDCGQRYFYFPIVAVISKMRFRRRQYDDTHLQ